MANKSTVSSASPALAKTTEPTITPIMTTTMTTTMALPKTPMITPTKIASFPSSIVSTSMMAKMRAAVITGSQRVEICDAPIPEPSAHEIRVRIEGCGVSESNMTVWEGRSWINYTRDAGSPGREAWGVVDAVGREVKHLGPGDRVAML